MAAMEAALVSVGLDVTVLTTDDNGPGRRFPSANMPAPAPGALRVYHPKRSEFYKLAPGLAFWLWGNVANFDVVHIHALFSFSSTVAGFIAAMRGVPYVVRPLGTLNSYGVMQRRRWLKRLSIALIERHILKRAAAVHFTSEAERQEAQALGLTMRPVVIPLGISPVTPGNADMLFQACPSVAGRVVILFLSRIDPVKNLEGLLRAHASFPQPRPALIIAGDGEREYVRSLKSLAVSLGLENDVIWLGHVSGEMKSAAFAAADIFALPSFSENFGIAVAEAMLAGLPVVVGRGVAIAGEIEAAGGGISVDPDPQSILSGLSRLLADPALRRRMGERARAHAQDAYSTTAMATRLIELYARVRLRPGSLPISEEDQPNG